MQIEFFQDREEPELFDFNKPGPSTCSAVAQTPTLKEASAIKSHKSSAGRTIKRSYLAKRAGNGNSSGKQSMDEVILLDDFEEEEISDTQFATTNGM